MCAVFIFSTVRPLFDILAPPWEKPLLHRNDLDMARDILQEFSTKEKEKSPWSHIDVPTTFWHPELFFQTKQYFSILLLSLCI